MTVANVLLKILDVKTSRDQTFTGIDLKKALSAEGLELPLDIVDSEISESDILDDFDYASEAVVINGENTNIYFPEYGNPNEYLYAAKLPQLRDFDVLGDNVTYMGSADTDEEEDYEESEEAEGEDYPIIEEPGGQRYQVRAEIHIVESPVPAATRRYVVRQTTW